MINNFKNLVSKLMIAHKKNCLFIEVQNNKLNSFLLNFLWDENLIYGYLLFCKNIFIVFFKNSKTSFSLIENTTYLNGSYSNIYFKNLAIVEKKTIVFILNDKGIFLNTYLTKLGLGGFKLFKL